MKKVSKAIKALQSLSDEEKLEVEDFFKVEQEEEKQEVEQKEEKQQEKKEEQKEDEVETEIEKLFKGMKEQIATLTKKVEKAQPFGAKQKQQGAKDSTEFDSLFANLRSKQRS